MQIGSRGPRWRSILGACILAACSGASVDRADPSPVEPNPPVPPAPKPTIVLSRDSVVATLTSGAPALAQEIDIGAGTTTSVSGLALVDTVPIGRDAWLAVSLSGTTAPAKLTIRLSPATVVTGRHDATIRVAATDAETKTVRVSLDVRPRPRLVLARRAIAFAGDVGGTFAADSIDVASVDGPVDSLAVSKPECSGVSAPWLAASLSAAKSPATLRIAAAALPIKAGTYTCSITVSTAQALVDSASQVVNVSLTLRAAPRIVVASDVPVSVFRLSDAPEQQLAITNGGTGELTGLSVGTISYEAPGNGWLTARLDSATAPAILSFVASAKALDVGTYRATIPIRSTASGVVEPTKHVTVTLSVLPRPSYSLIALPSTVRVTVKIGTEVRATATVTHSGDIPLSKMGFAPPTEPPPPSWIGRALGGCDWTTYSTPCTAIFTIAPPASVVPGVYTHTTRYGAFQEGLFTSITTIITVVP